jgi:hypothetical protein
MLSDLVKPFPAVDIEWRAGATNQEKTRALAMAYLTSRAVMNRLDDVVGPENWKDEYSAGPSGGVMCGISIRTADGWVTKFDVGENSDFEPVKGGFADAFKRAAVKWGIGRYLYNLDAVWHECEVRGKSVVLKGAPTLPKWALPSQASTPTTTGKVTQPIQPNTPGAPMTLEEAMAETNRNGKKFGEIATDKLQEMATALENALHEMTGEAKDKAERKLKAIGVILTARQAENE